MTRGPEPAAPELPQGNSARGTAAFFSVVLWLAFTAWLRPLTLPDEGRYASVAWEMLRSGDWLTPSLNGLPFFHKPPLFYWITAAALGLFGMNEWAARAASLVGAVVAAASIFLLVRRWAGPAAGRLTAVCLLTQPLFFMSAQFANLDMLLAGCVTATLALLVHSVLTLREGGDARLAVVAAYSFAALGVLAKGLIGFVLPALVMGAWLIASGQWRTMLRLWSWRGLAVFALLTVPWFVAMQREFPGFLHYFFVVQHFQRFVQSDFNNAQPAWFFPAVLLLFTLPWSLWLLARPRASWLSRGWWFAQGARGALRQVMAVWLLVILVFFSLPQSKLIGYILPAVPAFAFLIAEMVLTAGKGTAWRRLTMSCLVLGVVLCVAAALASAATPNRSLRDMGRTLGALRKPHDITIYVKNFYYDIAFYARLDGPVLVVDDWRDPQLADRDNWRKELLDARQFAKGLPVDVLITRRELEESFCEWGTGRVWLVGPRGLLDGDPLLADAHQVARMDNVQLWQLAPSLVCLRKRQ